MANPNIIDWQNAPANLTRPLDRAKWAIDQADTATKDSDPPPLPLLPPSNNPDGKWHWERNPANAVTDFRINGPQQPMARCRLSYVPSDNPDSGMNLIEMRTAADELALPPNVWLEIDNRICIDNYNRTAFNLGVSTGWSHSILQSIDTGYGAGSRKGKFKINLDASTMGKFTTSQTYRAALVRNAQNFILDGLYTPQNRDQKVDNSPQLWQNKCPAIAFKGGTQTTSPRNGIYRRHYCDGAPAGYGPNQFASAWDLLMDDMFSDGGNPARFEPDTADETGCFRVWIGKTRGSGGNRAFVISPHATDCTDFYVDLLLAYAMWEGFKVADNNGEGGSVARIHINKACIYGSPSGAQNPYPIAKWTANQKSDDVINQVQVWPDVWWTDVKRDGTFTRNSEAIARDTTKCDIDVATALKPFGGGSGPVTVSVGSVVSGASVQGMSLSASGAGATRPASVPSSSTVSGLGVSTQAIGLAAPASVPSTSSVGGISVGYGFDGAEPQGYRPVSLSDLSTTIRLDMAEYQVKL